MAELVFSEFRALLLVAWELALILLCVFLTIRTRTGGDGRVSFFSSALTWNLLAGAMVPMCAGFLRLHSTAFYLICSVALAAVSWRTAARPLSRAMRVAGNSLRGWTWNARGFAAAGIALVGLPVLLQAMRPIGETDSWVHLGYVIQWFEKGWIPYEFPNFYVSFWEASYLPGMILAGSDNYLWLTSLKPVLLILLVSLTLAERAVLPPHLRLLTAVGVVLLCPYWLGSSGVGTIKNDMIASAGFLLLAAGVTSVRESLRHAVFLIIAGWVFVTGKYNGPALCAVSLILVAWRWPRNRFRQALPAAGIAIVALTITTGHYYLKNWWLFHNPLYPFTIRVAGVSFEGGADISGTAIFDQMRRPEVWAAFFAPPGGLSPGGLLFPLLLIGSIGSAFWILARTVLGREDRNGVWPVYALMILAGWFLYGKAYYSAGANTGEMATIYLEKLASLRYAGGVVSQSEVFCAGLLWRAGLSQRTAVAILLVHMVSRIGVLYQHMFDVTSRLRWIAFCAAVLVVLSFLLVRITSDARLRAVALAALVVGAAPVVHRIQCREWIGYLQPVLGLTRIAPPSTLFHVLEEGQALNRYVATGGNLRHHWETGTFPVLRKRLIEGGTKPDMVVWLTHPWEGPPAPDRDARASDLLRYGYERVAGNEYSLLFRRTYGTGN
ncbi:MAG: hypothetical protein JNL98_22575 [Bryobacterales bacterium]|nr:hypothetical protein [Bryobacterales bacterium]